MLQFRDGSPDMPKFSNRADRSDVSSAQFAGAGFLAAVPVFAVFYVSLVLPFMGDAGKPRMENILFWPLLAILTLALVFLNRDKIDSRFLRSWPILSLIAYLAFAAASIIWAYSPDLALSRFAVQMLVTIVIVAPYALPISTKYTIAGAHLCYAGALAVSAVYVLATPPSPIGHPGFFTHKQELGVLAALGIILSSYELLHRGWRRLAGFVSMGLGFWLVFESQSKSALAFAFLALFGSWLILLLCRKIRLTPAFIVGAIVVASMFVPNPIERIGYRLFGDSTLTGRTGIWQYANYRISERPWFGWGFHSYYLVPNSPQNQAPGYIRDMPSSHSGYLELKLETGRIGYWIFLIFIYSSLHLLERVRRKMPLRAWCYLSIELFAILINITDSNWVTLNGLWMIYLLLVVDAVRVSLPSDLANSKLVPVQAFKRRYANRTGAGARSVSAIAL